jgi:hypothetical protein
MYRCYLALVFMIVGTTALAQNESKVIAIQQAQIQKMDRNLQQVAGPGQYNSVMQQIQAQATCTAIRPSGGWVFAVTRTDGSQSCDQLCTQLTEGQAGKLSCFNALHIYAANNAATENQALGFKTYRYNSCSNLSFGPNYCCCGN